MSVRRVARGLAGLGFVGSLVGSFASCGADPGAEIALDMKVPQGILDQATNVKLSVFDAEGATCDAAGSTGTVPAGAKVFQLKQEGCDAGKWCTSITLDQDGSEKMFAVEVTNASGLLAQGCAKAKIDQDPLAVAIKVVRYVPPACCNNGTLEIGELCDNGMADGEACSAIVGDEACASDCTTNEIALDRAVGGAAPAPGTKSQLVLAFSGGSGNLNGALRAAFSDSALAANPDVGVRFLSPDLLALTSPPPLVGPLKLPLTCANPTGAGAARNQNSPAMTPYGGDSVLVTYLSDETVPGKFNMYATKLGGSGCASGTPFLVNAVADNVTDPHVAAGPSGGALFVYAQNGALFGRLWDGTTLAATTIPLGNGATPRVAGSNAGYVVAYRGAGAADDDGIYAVTVSATGQVGSPISVNAKVAGVQDQPDVAALSDGRFAVVFHSATDIFMQRFDTGGAPVAGDQDAALNTVVDGEQSAPSVAGGLAPGAGEFFACAWQSDSGEIRGRLAGGSSGYLFNAIDGQNTEFVASVAGEAGSRARPAVAIGGSGYVVIGWEDTSGDHPGVFARRFPLPM